MILILNFATLLGLPGPSGPPGLLLRQPPHGLPGPPGNLTSIKTNITSRDFIYDFDILFTLLYFIYPDDYLNYINLKRL